MSKGLSFPTLKLLFHKHSSFLVLVFGSVTYYFLNVILKHVFSEKDYGEYSLFNGYLSIAMAFALLGGEQLLMRVAKKNEHFLVIPNKILKTSAISGLLFSICGAFIYYKFISNYVNCIIIFFTSILSGFTILGFSIFRIKGMFLDAQLQKNGWRIILICLVSVVVFIGALDFNILLLLINASLVFLVIRGLYKLKCVNMVDDQTYSIDMRLWLGYAFSMLVMNLLAYSDRFIIDRYLGINSTGEYFYMQNLFLFPLTQIQAYVGFKELSVFKERFSTKYFNNRIRFNLALGIAIALITVIAIYIVGLFIHSFKIKWGNNLALIILLLVTGICRTVYSILSAAMGAIGNYRMIRYTNVLTVLFFIGCFTVFFLIGFSLISITLMFLLVWLFRCFVYYFYLLRFNT